MPSPTAFKSIKVFDHDYAYLDSGAPDSANYTTWVTIHGLSFNGAIFEKLLPLAPTRNLRIVSIYRRGYPPSSGFKEDELKVIGRGKKLEEAEPFYRSQGIEIATFLAQFATEQDIPLADANDAIGGIVLIGWSLGITHAFTVLAFANELPEATRSILQKYLHTILAHDLHTSALGIPNPERGDASLWFEKDDRARFNDLFDWGAAHFIHKSVTSGNIDDLEFTKPSDIPRSLCDISSEQRGEYTNMEPLRSSGCDAKLMACDLTAHAAIAKRALFDRVCAEALPDVRVRCMSGGTSTGWLIWSVWVLQKHLENPKGLYGPDAEEARDIKIINQTEGNHFIFWEDPEKAIQHYSTSVNL